MNYFDTMNSRVLCVVALCFVAVAMAGPAVDETPNLNSVSLSLFKSIFKFSAT